MELFVNIRYVTGCMLAGLNILTEYFCMSMPPFVMQIRSSCLDRSAGQ